MGHSPAVGDAKQPSPTRQPTQSRPFFWDAPVRSNTEISCKRRLNEGGREVPANSPPLVSCISLFGGRRAGGGVGHCLRSTVRPHQIDGEHCSQSYREAHCVISALPVLPRRLRRPPDPSQDHRLSEAQHGHGDEADDGPRVQDHEHCTWNEKVLDEVAQIKRDAHHDQELRQKRKRSP